MTYLIVFGAAPAAALALLASIRIGRWLRTRARERVQEPAHTGATEAYAAELRALRDVEVPPELVSAIEEELRWGQLWHDFEAALHAEVDRIFAPALALAECEDFEQVHALVDDGVLAVGV